MFNQCKWIYSTLLRGILYENVYFTRVNIHLFNSNIFIKLSLGNVIYFVNHGHHFSFFLLQRFPIQQSVKVYKMKISDIPLKRRKGIRDISLRIQTDISYIKRAQRHSINLSLNRKKFILPSRNLEWEFYFSSCYLFFYLFANSIYQWSNETNKSMDCNAQKCYLFVNSW